jgi:hypothetical protein
VQEFEAKIFELQRTTVNQAYDDAKALIAKGELKVKPGQNSEQVAGMYVDERSRLALRKFSNDEALDESNKSPNMGVNRYIRSDVFPGWGVPDNRTGANLLMDTTLAFKTGNTRQIVNWAKYIPDLLPVMMRPDQLGGPYVIPPASIRRSTPQTKGGV